ncbi:MAG: hypothetical protein MUF25_02810 [Pirellulaceae bacterium]|nr:hypothetical protein [Pirellulaceae bacterium]
MKVPPGQAGQKCRCPRCNAEVVAPPFPTPDAPLVTPPQATRASRAPVKPPQAPPKPFASTEDDGDDLRLSAAVDRLPATHASPSAGRAVGADARAAGSSAQSGPPKTGGRTDVIGDQARQVLAKARAEAEEVERARPRLPERPFVTGVLSFLADSDAALRWLMLTLLLHAAVVLFSWIVELSRGAGIAQMGALLMTLAATVLTLVFAATAAASCLAILQDTASGRDKIENWPGIQILDWMMDVFYVVNALLTAALPGLFLGGTLMCMGGKVGSAIYGGAFSSIALFPLFLISMVTEGSAFSLACPDVWGTVWTQPRWWGKFYLLSAALGLVLLVLGRITVGSGFFLQGLCSAVAVAAVMVYFRLLGRLAWCLSSARTTAARPSR